MLLFLTLDMPAISAIIHKNLNLIKLSAMSPDIRTQLHEILMSAPPSLISHEMSQTDTSKLI